MCLVLLTPIALIRMIKGAYSIAEKAVTPRKAGERTLMPDGSRKSLVSVSDVVADTSQDQTSSTRSTNRESGEVGSPRGPMTFETTIGASESLSVLPLLHEKLDPGSKFLSRIEYGHKLRFQ